jgi:hypothetical protein
MNNSKDRLWHTPGRVFISFHIARIVCFVIYIQPLSMFITHNRDCRKGKKITSYLIKVKKKKQR